MTHNEKRYEVLIRINGKEFPASPNTVREGETPSIGTPIEVRYSKGLGVQELYSCPVIEIRPLGKIERVIVDISEGERVAK